MEVKEVKVFEIPKEIDIFFKSVFELLEIRGVVGGHKGIKFVVHTNDHNPPHVHAKYDNYEISISLIDFSVLAGNIPKKNKNIAIRWVKEHREYLLEYWSEKTLISTLPLTRSTIDSKEPVKI